VRVTDRRTDRQMDTPLITESHICMSDALQKLSSLSKIPIKNYHFRFSSSLSDSSYEEDVMFLISHLDTSQFMIDLLTSFITATERRIIVSLLCLSVRVFVSLSSLSLYKMFFIGKNR